MLRQLASGSVKYAQKKFLLRHFIKFVKNQIFLPRILLRRATHFKSTK